MAIRFPSIKIISAASNKVASVYAKFGGTGTANQMVRKFINNAVKANKANSPAFKRTISKLARQKGSTTVKSLSRIAGFATVVTAGVKGAKKIAKAGGKANREIKRLGEQTSAQQESILVGLRRRRRKRQLANKKLTPDEERALESAGAKRRFPALKK